ncbi:MAG: ABC transporter substrate-binding protein [Chloroflexi bacterium HGW-Chloroflexi-10]|nr:MAG: ABC transporter substrate-binding protein [Chloroflexi bacterium HGW-Chloroflexi-10]
MSKKFLPLISLMLIAMFILAACKPAATPVPTTAPVVVEPAATDVPAEPTAVAEVPTTAPAADVTTITIWNQWDGKYLEAIEAAFADYESLHPDVVIDLSKPEDVKNALTVAIPAGEGPDIIGWANDAIGEQALIGNIVAVSDYGITDAFLASTYEPAAVAGVTWMGQIWGLPETQEGIALVYNKDLVTEEYLPTDPMDFEDLYEKAKKFQEDTGNVLVCNQGFGASDAYHMSPIYFGHGVPSYVDEEGVGYLNSPEMVAGAEWLKKFATVSLAENTYDICNAALSEGKIGMWWTGPWAVAGVEESGVNYGILPMGSPFVGIKTLLLTTNAVDRGNTDIALDVMKYFTSAEVQKKLSLVNKTIPAATEALNDPEVAQLTAVVGFGASLNLGVPMSPSPFSSAQWGPVGDASAAIWTGAKEPAAALDEAQAALEEAVAGMK